MSSLPKIFLPSSNIPYIVRIESKKVFEQSSLVILAAILPVVTQHMSAGTVQAGACGQTDQVAASWY